MSDCICNVPIARMAPGFFWTRLTLIPGVSEEEAELFLARQLPLERTAEVEGLVLAASAALRDAPLPGVQDWMPVKRAMS